MYENLKRHLKPWDDIPCHPSPPPPADLADSYNNLSGMLGRAEWYIIQKNFLRMLDYEDDGITSFETSVAIYQSTWHNVTIHLNLQQRSYLKLTSKNNYNFVTNH